MSKKRKSSSNAAAKPTKCSFCNGLFPSKTKLFLHLNSGDCQPAITAGYQPKANKHITAMYIGHDGTNAHFLDTVRHTLANVLTAMHITVPWNENDKTTYKWTATTRTKSIFSMEPNVPRVEEMIALSLPSCNHTILLQKLNNLLPPNIHVWRIVGPLPKGAHLHADTDCSKRRMECLVPWQLFCPNANDASAPHQDSLTSHSFHQFLMGFVRSAPSLASPLSLLGRLSIAKKDHLVREIFHFLVRPNTDQLNALKRMKRTLQAFQGYRSLHNFTSHDGVLPQNSSIQQKIERFGLKGIVMVHKIPCIVITCSFEKYVPIGTMRSLIGLAIAVYRGLLPSESIPILLRNFSEKMAKKSEVQDKKKKTKKKNNKNQQPEKQEKEMEPSSSKSTTSTTSTTSTNDKETNDLRFNTNSYRRPLPSNVGVIAQKVGTNANTTSSDVGGSVVLNVVHGLSIPVQCMYLHSTHCAYWERKHRTSLVNVEGTIEGIKAYDIRTGYRRLIIDRIGTWWSQEHSISNFEQEFEAGVTVIQSRILGLMALSSASLSSSSSSSLPSLAPTHYREVLRHLRLLRNSHAWPTTSTGRAKLIQIDDHDKEEKEDEDGDGDSKMGKSTISSTNDDETTKNESGSFTCGFMPNVAPPKANVLFPSLMREIFHLEKVIMQGRPGSACCAVNCNAKFRPHKDSGAGNGQQISLIVGLGEYQGGQLGVEGTVHDIQYKPLEFDGWKQRHWTLPFNGERFSLVWFTPNGCGPNDTGLNLAMSAAKVKAARVSVTTVPDAVYNGYVLLRNDVQMPMMGIGTYQLKGELCSNLIRHAFTHGRSQQQQQQLLIDTAEMYNNHADVRNGISNIERKKYFLMTKLSSKNMNTTNDVYRAFQQSSRELLGENGGVLDAYLLHWVAPHGNSPDLMDANQEARIRCWLAMEQLYWKGYVRCIGVSNFTIKHLELLLDDERVTIVPFVNQVEIHPLFPQDELRLYCKSKQIVIQAYASLGQGNVSLLQHETIVEEANKCNITPAELCLLFGLLQEIPICVKAGSVKHLEENLNVSINVEKKMINLAASIQILKQIVKHKKFGWDSRKF